LKGGNPFVVGTEAERPHDLGRLEEEIHHVLVLRLTDCSNHSVRIVRILDEDDRLAGWKVQEDLVCQRLVACDAVKQK
jgi:hypothetical protein